MEERNIWKHTTRTLTTDFEHFKFLIDSSPPKSVIHNWARLVCE